MSKTNQIIKLFISLVICFGAGAFGAIFTSSGSLDAWYADLIKPSFNPPNWVFGPVWTILYILMAVSVFLVWRKSIDSVNAKKALAYFLVQLGLNAFWTPLFFGFHLILFAFIDIILLWIMILITILAFKRLSQTAAVLLIPYLVWVGFAAILNGAIWFLNN